MEKIKLEPLSPHPLQESLEKTLKILNLMMVAECSFEQALFLVENPPNNGVNPTPITRPFDGVAVAEDAE